MIEFRVGSLAHALDVHRNTIRNWIKNGKLPAVSTVGKRYSLRVEDLARFCVQEKVAAHRLEALVPADERQLFHELMHSANDIPPMPSTPENAAMVVGGGVAGIQAALDLKVDDAFNMGLKKSKSAYIQ